MTNVLIIEDNKGMRELMRIILTRFGYRVAQASDGLTGIAQFNAGSLDVVITDLNMPGLDGNQVAEYICNSKAYRVPVIGVSATPEALSTNLFARILSKPFTASGLIETLESVGPNAHPVGRRPLAADREDQRVAR